MVSLSVCFASCSSDDDDDDVNEATLTGTWIQSPSEDIVIKLTFKSDNTGTINYLQRFTENDSIEAFTYKFVEEPNIYTNEIIGTLTVNGSSLDGFYDKVVITPMQLRIEYQNDEIGYHQYNFFRKEFEYL